MQTSKPDSFTSLSLSADDVASGRVFGFAIAGAILWHVEPGVGQHHRADSALPHGGYALGGRWADRSPKAETLFGIIAWPRLPWGGAICGAPVLLIASRGFADSMRGCWPARSAQCCAL